MKTRTKVNLFSRRIQLLIVVVLFSLCNTFSQVASRVVRAFDEQWSFKKDNITSGPEKASFDVSGWRKVDVPHDWSIEDLPNQIPDSIVGPFSKASIGKRNTGFVIGGTAWYRKAFKTQKDDLGKTVYLQFDGVYQNSDVWINGYHLGNHPYGYTSFYYDLTPYLKPVGKDNIVAVQVKNEGENSRWYSGSGIYRHVWLIKVNPIHVDMWGVYVTTPKVSKSSADVQVLVTVKNTGKETAAVSVQTQLIEANGKVVGSTKSKIEVQAGEKSDAKQVITIKQPKLWSTQEPNLYKAKVTVLMNDKETDNVNTTFGVREVKIDPDRGLLINGVSVKLKGGCIHHDYGPLGAAALDRAEERKIELLKANGYNAIRTSHNPPSPLFLDICDRLGMLVVDEAFDVWNKPKNPDDYHLYFKEWWNKDLTSMIRRDRNHPSVIIWSIGNEVPERGDSLGEQTRKMLVQRVRELDNTRKVTEAICIFKEWHKTTPAFFTTLDVVGYNYLPDYYEKDRLKAPRLVAMATESLPKDILYYWDKVEKLPYVIGDFVWTAMDYLGEAGLGAPIDGSWGKWPWMNAFCGDLDLVGNKKPQSYYRDVVWRNSPIEIMAKKYSTEKVSPWGWPNMERSWNWPGEIGKLMQVFVYSRCQVVKLELNGKVIGEKTVPVNSITAIFDSIPYQSGTLVAKGFDNGKEVASVTLKTTGAPSAIRLKADRNKIKASRNDLSYISVEVVDAAGNVVPDAENIEVHFTVSGNGELAGVGNANPVDMSSFQLPKKKTYHGKASVILRPKGNAGKIELRAHAQGLIDAFLEVVTQ